MALIFPRPVVFAGCSLLSFGEPVAGTRLPRGRPARGCPAVESSLVGRSRLLRGHPGAVLFALLLPQASLY